MCADALDVRRSSASSSASVVTSSAVERRSAALAGRPAAPVLSLEGLEWSAFTCERHPSACGRTSGTRTRSPPMSGGISRPRESNPFACERGSGTCERRSFTCGRLSGNMRTTQSSANGGHPHANGTRSHAEGPLPHVPEVCSLVRRGPSICPGCRRDSPPAHADNARLRAVVLPRRERANAGGRNRTAVSALTVRGRSLPATPALDPPGVGPGSGHLRCLRSPAELRVRGRGRIRTCDRLAPPG